MRRSGMNKGVCMSKHQRRHVGTQGVYVIEVCPRTGRTMLVNVKAGRTVGRVH